MDLSRFSFLVLSIDVLHRTGLETLHMRHSVDARATEPSVLLLTLDLRGKNCSYFGVTTREVLLFL